jgi:asparagine synthase (glutamine-hydrolysing)
MCGIFGFIGPWSKDVLMSMDSILAHRGPDGAGQYFEARAQFAIGHRRLAIIDPTDNARQPMISRCGNFVISFNGEIYNYREIASHLLQKGIPLRTTSDTEALLELLL